MINRIVINIEEPFIEIKTFYIEDGELKLTQAQYEYRNGNKQNL